MTDPYVPQVPASQDEATVKLERFALLTGQLVAAEESREAAIASTHLVADAISLPIKQELEQLRADLEPWWATAGAGLTKGKRKTVLLGGCKIGEKAGADKLAHSHPDDAAAVEALMGVPWMRKACVKASYGLDRVALKAHLQSQETAAARAKADALGALGFRVDAGSSSFVLERPATPGIVG